MLIPFVLFLFTSTSTLASAQVCAASSVLTREFCARPPVDKISLSAYSGKWYESYATANARHSVSDPKCVTAEYEVIANSSVSVLNCYHQREMYRPECVSGTAITVDSSGSRLDVRFGGRGGPYIVAAIIGDDSYGYSAVAVYNCRWIRGEPVEKWGVLVRSPWQSKYLVSLLMWRLRCKGYNVDSIVWEDTHQGAGCQYWFGPRGYDLRAV